MLTKISTRPYWKTILFSVLAGILILIITLAGVLCWSVDTLRTNTLTRLRFAQQHLDTILSNAREAAVASQYLVGRPCSDRTLAQLRYNVIRTPNVRAIDLVLQGRVYCTSLNGETYVPDRTEPTETGNTLQLLSGNAATPHLPVLVYRSWQQQGSLLVGIDGYFIAETLFVIHTLPQVFFRVGEHVLTKDGRVLALTQLPDGERYTLSSSEWPYQLVTVTSMGTWRDNILLNDRGSLLCSLLFALVTSLLCYRMLARPLTPLRQLKNGLTRREFVPYIQPIVDIATRRVKGGEILIRWLHPQAGVIPPNQFIPLAESSGLIVPMTRQLFADTSLFFSSHTHHLPAGFHLGFNISQQHLLDDHIIADCENIMAALSDCHTELVLELLERDTAECTDDMRSAFRTLQDMGVKFALDDFGTGYSTHAYLQNFSVNYIKVDKSFIQMIGIDDISHHIVDNVIALAENLNIDIIAEGVETTSQVVYLQAHHVKYLQGYIYSRPIPLDEFVVACKTGTIFS